MRQTRRKRAWFCEESDSTYKIKTFRRDNKCITVWLSLTMRLSRCDLCSQDTMRLESSCKLKVERMPQYVLWAKSKDKKCQIWNCYGGRHRNTVAKRDICQPKHEGKYKRTLHRVSLLAGYDKTGKSFQARSRMSMPYRVEEHEMPNLKW